jgi:general secretion pathway protein E
MREWRLLGDILEEDHGVPREMVEEALKAQQTANKRFGELLIGIKAVTPEALTQALATQQGFEFLKNIPTDFADSDLFDLIPISFAKEHRIFPWERSEGRLKIVVADPLNTRPLNDLAALTHDFIDVVLSTEAEILRVINSEKKQTFSPFYSQAFLPEKSSRE